MKKPRHKATRNSSRGSDSSTPTRLSTSEKQSLFASSLLIDFKRDDFTLDFNSSSCGDNKSTTDNFQSDEESKFKFLKAAKMSRPKNQS
jgi:hypothetical protein